MLSSHTVGFQRPDNSNLANLTPGLCSSSWSCCNISSWLYIYKYNNIYVEIFGWCASTQKGDVQKSTLKNESNSRERTFQHGPTAGHDLDNKMLTIKCIVLCA